MNKFLTSSSIKGQLYVSKFSFILLPFFHFCKHDNVILKFLTFPLEQVSIKGFLFIKAFIQMIFQNKADINFSSF